MNVKPISPTYPIRQMKNKKENPKFTTPPNRDIDFVARTLDVALEHGMAAEVMWSALNMAAEANAHGQTMENVLDAALGEWDIDPDHPLTKSDEGQMYNMSAKEAKRHRGLEIGEDGTVNKLI